MRPPCASPNRRHLPVVCCLALVTATLAALSVTAAGPAAGQSSSIAVTELVRTGSAATMQVFYRGNGHGHGMSQYGARGAAIQGRSTAQILAFYYPRTQLTTLAPSTIRVRLSGATADTTVLSGPFTVNGYRLPTAGYSQFRLVPSGSGLAVQGRTAATWKTIKKGLPSRADFSSTNGWVQLLLSGGTSTRYRGSVGAVRSGSGEITVNRVSLDGYTQGVAPREMPASWDLAAVRAQAIAARSYAKSSMNATGGGGSSDICDTTMCQVYGGMAHYDSGGNLLYSDDSAAIAGNQNMVLSYQGVAIFAQYSASNGGATVDGGTPYLVGKADPYDAAASGDPYLDQQSAVSVASVAGRYGLRSISSIEVSRRDGNGPWGGRVESAYVNGTTSSGASAHLSTTGFELGANLGVYTDYLRFAFAPTVPTRPSSFRAVARDAGARISWTPPGSDGNQTITGYVVRFRTRSLSLPPTARATWIGPLANMRATSVTVQAVNAKGVGPVAAVWITPRPSPQRIVAVRPKPLFDTRAVTTVIDPAHPFRFSVAGHGSIPVRGVRSVQLAVTVLHPSASGVLTVASTGVAETPMAAVAYRAGHSALATVSVPLLPSSTLVFTPSAGSVELLAYQESYTGARGALISTAPRQQIGSVANVPTGHGVTLSLAGLRGIAATTKGVLVAVDARTRGADTFLRLWSDGPVPAVQQVAVTPNASGVNTLIVQLGATHTLHLAAGASGTTARVTLLGVLGPTGGRFETFPANPIRDGVSRVAVGTTAVSVPLVGVSQVPASGVSAVLVQVTVRSTGHAGWLWVYPGHLWTRPAAPAVIFSGTGSATATALVRVGRSGKVKLASSVPGVQVSVDAIGYVTTF